MKKCKVCGSNAYSDYCFRHKKHNLSRKRITPSSDEQMRELFLSIWKERPHRSELSKTPLGKEAKTIFFHHILPKQKYKDARYDKENIILLTFPEHQNVEVDIYRYEEINKRRIKLLEKYERDR